MHVSKVRAVGKISQVREAAKGDGPLFEIFGKFVLDDRRLPSWTSGCTSVSTTLGVNTQHWVEVEVVTMSQCHSLPSLSSRLNVLSF